MYTLEDLLRIMTDSNATDLFVSRGAFPTLRINGEIHVIEDKKLDQQTLLNLRRSILTPWQQKQFESEHDLNFVYSMDGYGRFRINYFRQRGSDSFVVHQILNEIKTIDELNLPPLFKSLAQKDRGLILVVGRAGSGKSTSIAAMIDYRNSTMPGHILTLEDPIEFLHDHKKSIINQREIGQDTLSYSRAIRSAMGESFSMILIGEIRDMETMSAALNFAETGHLVISTVQATNTQQAVDRILSFYDSYSKESIRMQISLNLTALITQRLVPTLNGETSVAMEIMFPSSRIKDLIHMGDTHLIPAAIESSNSTEMQTLDQSLFKLYTDGVISKEVAIRQSDNQSDQRLRISQEEEHIYGHSIRLKEDL